MKRNQGTADANRQRKQPGMQINTGLYARIKAMAALRGVRIGDVVDDAMQQYLDRQEDRL